MSKLLSASLLATGIAFAMPVAAQQQQDVTGTLRDTSNVDLDKWQTKYLGGQHIPIPYYANDQYYYNVFGEPDTAYNWESQRSLNADGTPNTSGSDYNQPFIVPSDVTTDAVHWARDPNLNLDSWISPSSDGVAENGFYSYVTTIQDDFSHLDADFQTVTFSHLDIAFFSDESMQAIFINGDLYTSAQTPDYPGWFHGNQGVLTFNNVTNWNVNGVNTIEFVVYNTGLTSNYEYWLGNNPTGLSASIQANYTITTIPEPETYAMLLAGLGIVGAAARRRRTSAMR